MGLSGVMGGMGVSPHVAGAPGAQRRVPQGSHLLHLHNGSSSPQHA